jgi:hypothetical protein
MSQWLKLTGLYSKSPVYVWIPHIQAVRDDGVTSATVIYLPGTQLLVTEPAAKVVEMADAMPTVA